VPDYAEIDFEIRTPSLDLMTSVFEKIEQMVAQANASYKRGGVPCRVTLHLKANVPPPWPRNPGTQRLFSYWEQAAAELGFSVVAEDRGGGSDANNLSHFCPTIDGLGPGGTNAHCAEVDPATNRDQEYLLVDSIVPKALLDVVAITKLLESGALPGA
jgi:metal-dependent amidase/aminoacylase/carboxypeptidase family protein